MDPSVLVDSCCLQDCFVETAAASLEMLHLMELKVIEPEVSSVEPGKIHNI
jgi:hypothetical protein